METNSYSPGKKLYVALIPGLILLMAMLTSACSDDVRITHTYTYYEPVYTTVNDIRAAFEIIEPQVIHSPGKIYYLNGYIFLNEPGKGIHIIDNTDPANPVNEAFINIPGNFDMAARGNVLYADSYVDLLAIDISNFQDVKILKRVESAFPVNYHVFAAGQIQPEEVIFTEFREVKQVDVYEDELGDMVYPGLYHWGFGYLATAEFASFDGRSVSAPTGDTGIGGSMARFTIMDKHLYTVDAMNLQVFDITTPEDPQPGNTINVGWNIETIFPYEDKIFIGSASGMYIYDASNADNPQFMAQFEHAQSCDPVIVDNDIAYVTLRSGSECQGFTNQLEVVNVSDLNNPELMKIFLMDNPHGLGKDGNLLFIAEGEFGLKVFDASNPLTVGDKLIKHYEGIHAYDVIPLGGILLMTGEDGLNQYDYTDPENIKLISTISVVPEL